MTISSDIFALACTYVQADEEDRETLRRLCAAVEANLKTKLRRDVTPEDCVDCFTTAAALLAAADFAAAYGDLGVESFSAGGVSVSRRDAATTERYRHQAALLLAPWCQDAFCFLGV